MSRLSRLVTLVGLSLVVSSCTGDASTETTAPLDGPIEPETTTSTAGVPEPSQPADIEWTTVVLDVGISHITQWRDGVVGLAVQDFEAPSSLIDEDDTGCVGFQAGRSGEVVWSPDGLRWEPLPAQPNWYGGPLSPEEWGRRVASGEVPSLTKPVSLLTDGDRLLAISFEELTETRSSAVVDAFDPSEETWHRLGSLDSVGSNRAAVAAASGVGGTIVVATGPDRDPTAWAVGEAGLIEFAEPFAAMTADAEWADDVQGAELVATTEGFLGQFEIGFDDALMAFSTDGAAWVEVAHPASGPVRLAASGTSVLGYNGDGMWISRENGESWQAVSLEQPNPFVELTGSESGFAAWRFEDGWASPGVWQSRDGVEWVQVLELSDDHGWINGLSVTDDALVVSASAPSDGWVCSEITLHEYEVHVGTIAP